MATRIKDLPLNNTPAPTQFVATDLSATQRLSIQSLVDTGAPVASEAEALAGTNATKRMTPLTTKQAIDASLALVEGVVDPRMYGAVGDGTTDDTAAINATVSAMAGNGVPLVGGGLTYAVNGNIDLGAIFHLENIKFKQLDPGKNNRRTLTSSNCLYGQLKNVTVDRNGDGTYTGGTIPAIDDADIGIRIACNTDGRIYIEGCTVTGDGFGGGIAVYNAAMASIRNNRIYAMKAGSPTYTALTDDAIEGIKVGNCQDIDVTGNVINGLSTEYTGHAEWSRFTRGIAVSGGAASGLTVADNKINSVDQAIDISGNMFPKRINVEGNKISAALTFGVKCANSAREIFISGNNITQCGIAGIVVSAPNEPIAVNGVSLANCSGAILIGGNFIREVGDNNPSISVDDISGVLVLTNHPDYAGYPRDIRIFNNDIEGNGNMLYGIKSTVVYSGGPGIVENNNRIETYTTSRVLAVQYDSVNLFNSANLSVPNNAVTAITFTAEDDDNSAMAALPASSVTIRRTGYYNLEGQVFWAANATGDRQLYFYRNGNPIPRARSSATPPANDFTLPLVRIRLFLTEGDTVSLRAFQNSGGALNIRFEYSWFTVMRAS